MLSNSVQLYVVRADGFALIKMDVLYRDGLVGNKVVRRLTKRVMANIKDGSEHYVDGCSTSLGITPIKQVDIT